MPAPIFYRHIPAERAHTDNPQDGLQKLAIVRCGQPTVGRPIQNQVFQSCPFGPSARSFEPSYLLHKKRFMMTQTIPKWFMGLLNNLGPCPIDTPGKTSNIRERVCSKKSAQQGHAWPSVSQRRQPLFGARSVLSVREHGKRATCLRKAAPAACAPKSWLQRRAQRQGTPLVAFFNSPVHQLRARPKLSHGMALRIELSLLLPI